MATKVKRTEMEGEATRLQCFKMRISGKTYQQIGDAMGMTRQGAFKHVHKELKAIQAENKQLAEHYRDMELNRLDMLFDYIMEAISKGDSSVLAQAHKNIELRCKLLGVNAPQEININAVTPEDILLDMNVQEE